MTRALVRLATAADDLAVGELLVESFVTAYALKMPEVVVTPARKAELRAVAAKRRVAAVWVLELDGRLVGTVSLFPPGATESEAWRPGAADLRHLATDPRLHGQGLAQPLLDAAERHAFSGLGLAEICLHVRRGNFGVARLYQRRGYLRDPTGDMERPGVGLEAYYLPRPLGGAGA